MKILALIPARGGSKRLPRKNIKLLGSKPLINWTIEAAQGVSEICDILVSTDDPEIASLAREAGANVPWLRPHDLSSDESSTADVALHALDWYENENGPVDGLLLLQPTSPFRTRATIIRGIEIFQNQAQLEVPVIGVSESESHPSWMFKLQENSLIPFLPQHGLQLRAQNLEPVYVVNGCFYLISPTTLRLNKNFFAPKSIPLVITSPHETIDIDTEWDFQLAIVLVEMQVKNKENRK
jgi:CMP-N,N'-diacetyllegionaminic acid synthase